MVPLLRRVAEHVLAAEGFRSGTLSIAVVSARAGGFATTRYPAQS